MALSNAYATLAELKYRIGLGQGVTSDDALLEDLLGGACRAIDLWTGGRFYASTETRYYTAENGYCLKIDDLLSVTTLKSDEDGDRTYEITWAAATDYYLEPVNNALLNKPYTSIEADTVNGSYTFPVGVRRGVQVVGSFGYASTTPLPVREAALRLAARLYKLKDAVLGVAGSPETGVVRINSDRDINELLWPYRREWGVA